MQPSMIRLVVVGVAAAISLTAIAIAAGPYDGTYRGVSISSRATSSNKGNHCVITATAPAPLTIANGHASTKWGSGALEGDVGPNGKLIMHSPTAGRFEGQIDASGAVKGYYMSSCILDLVWQHKG